MVVYYLFTHHASQFKVLEFAERRMYLRISQQEAQLLQR